MSATKKNKKQVPMRLKVGGVMVVEKEFSPFVPYLERVIMEGEVLCCCTPDPLTTLLQETSYSVASEDLLVPQYSINGSKGGTLAVSKGSQWLHHFALAPKGTSVASLVHFKWLGLVECYSTKDKPWLLYRIQGAVYSEKRE